MRIIILIFLILTSCTKNNNSKDVVEKRDGLAYKKGTSELFSGIRTGYTENGKVSFEIKYEGGVRNGKATWFYENGQKKLEGHIIKEKKEGEWKGWSEDGVLSLEMTYSNDKLNGRYTEYYSNGKIAEIGFKKDDKFQGIGKSFDENGNLKGVLHYVNGFKQEELKSFYENGALYVKANYNDDKLEGPFIVYHKNGEIASSGFNKAGKLEGRWLYYDSLRHLLEERFYKDSVLINKINYTR